MAAMASDPPKKVFKKFPDPFMYEFGASTPPDITPEELNAKRDQARLILLDEVRKMRRTDCSNGPRRPLRPGGG